MERKISNTIYKSMHFLICYWCIQKIDCDKRDEAWNLGKLHTLNLFDESPTVNQYLPPVRNYSRLSNQTLPPWCIQWKVYEASLRSDIGEDLG
jgi:transposase